MSVDWQPFLGREHMKLDGGRATIVLGKMFLSANNVTRVDFVESAVQCFIMKFVGINQNP